MKQLLRVLLFVSAFVVTGCASIRGALDTEISQSVCSAEPSVPVDDPLCFQRAAELNYEHAILATLAYDPENTDLVLPIPPAYSVSSVEIPSELMDTPGFQFKVFDQVIEGELVERVIAYRGTDEFWEDWILTNLFGSRAQNRAALELFEHLNDNSTHISVVGDSLGGGLATQVSVCHQVERRLALNTSPRFVTSLCPEAEGLVLNEGNTYLYQESGQILGVTTPFRYSTQLYTKVDCMARQSPFRQHDVRALAVCITLEASLASDEATEYVTENCNLFMRIATDSRFRGYQYNRLIELCSA